jgi:hypothetical protein
MPSWLLPILQLFGPAVVKFALGYLNSKYPGLSEVLKEILKYIETSNDKALAVNDVKQTLYTSAVLPSVKKDS